ncbi:GGDEF domain-containing protein [Deinococcus carri]
MRDPCLPFPDVLPPADAWRGRGLLRKGTNRRESYQTVLPLALLGTLLPLALPGPAPAPVLAVTLLGLAGLLGLVLVLTLVPRCPLRVLDLLLLLGGWALLLGELAFRLFGAATPGAVLSLGNMLPWCLVLLLAPAWLLGERQGRVVSGAALGSLLLLTLLFAAGPMGARGPEGSALLNALLQVQLAGGVALLGQQAAGRRARTAARCGSWSGMADQECDPLTGLPGYPALERVLAGHLPQRPAGLTVAVLALDGLEEAQAERGVAFAQVLRAHVARTLTAATRDEDVVGCLGDGTFAVLMRVPDARSARAACERLRVRVASRPLQGVLPTVSVGVTVWAGHTSGRALLTHAQQALAQARQDGGNRVHLGTEAGVVLAAAPAA